MSHYEQRLQADLEAIRARLRETCKDVEAAIGSSTKALLARDADAASRIALGDLPINRTIREIDHMCHVFVARHLPSAGILRTISAVMRLDIEVERVGDYAVTIARETPQLSDDIPEAVARDIERMCERAQRQFAAATKAFLDGDAEAAREVKEMAQDSRATFRSVFRDLVDEADRARRPITDLFAMLTVLNRLERVGDQAKNIAEEAIFSVTGETKAPKTYRVLFVDRANDGRSVLAEAIARGSFPESGRYSSAGWEPGERLNTAVVDFIDRRGLNVGEMRPKALATSVDELSKQHVIVCLDPAARDKLAVQPFHTAVIDWPAEPTIPGDATCGEAALESVYRDLAARVEDLMTTLRGAGAA